MFLFLKPQKLQKLLIMGSACFLAMDFNHDFGYIFAHTLRQCAQLPPAPQRLLIYVSYLTEMLVNLT